jgi:phosphatidylinositol alpha-1,6-mannosyltransferase
VVSLLISEIFPPKTGGSGRWFWEIYRRLPREQFLIAAGEDPRQGPFDSSHDLRVARLPLRLPAWGIRSWAGIRGYFRALKRLLPLVRSGQVTMVHCGRCLPEGVMALALRAWLKLPYLCYVHGEDMRTASDSREHAFLVRRVLAHAEFMIANSFSTKRILREEWDIAEERIRVLHPGVDTSRFLPCARDSKVRFQLGWNDRPVVLTVGRLQKRKGHDQLIRSLSTVRKSIPDVLYAIVGDGEERPELEAIVAQEGLSGHVQFLGEMDDGGLIRCYQQCDLFTLPNRQVGKDIEGFGMVLLEAQACGKPVLAGASGGTAETMSIPETGLVVDCEQPNLLADKLIEILKDPDRLAFKGRAARSWVVDHFDWTPLACQAAELFQCGLRIQAVRPVSEPVQA